MNSVEISYTGIGIFISAFVAFGGLVGFGVTVGNLTRKLKSNCNSIGILNKALWKDGRPLLQSVKTCDKERDDLKESCREILDQLKDMDKKRDKAVDARNKQMLKIELHMQKIDTWYEDTHGKATA